MFLIQIFDVLWLVSLLVLLFLIWRSSEKRSKQNQHAQDLLIEVIQRNTESAHRSVQLAHEALDLVRKDRA